MKIKEFYEKKLKGNKYFEFVKVVVISLAIIIPIRTYLIEPFYVKGTSMLPNFVNYDYLLINKLGYHIGDPKRLDIVVAKFAENKPYVIKRIIGMPEDILEFNEGIITITEKNGNKFALEEPYLDPNNIKKEEMTVQIPKGSYFIMGDNRAVSYDSRQQGPIARDHLKGRVLWRVLNFSFIVDTFYKIFPALKPITIYE